MSFEATASVLRADYKSPRHKLLMLGIASHADPEGGNAWPTQATLATYASATERTVIRLLAELEADGMLTIDRHGGGTLKRSAEGRRPNLYSITPAGMTGNVTQLEPELGDIPAELGDISGELGDMTPLATCDDATGRSFSESPSESPRRAASPAESDPGFDAFWSEYPRKIDKAAARRAWKSATKQTTEGDILGGLVRWKFAWVAAETAPEYIPHPTTWLNRHRWESTPDIGTAAKTGADPLADAIRQHLAASGIDVESRMDDRERADFDARLTKAITAVSRMGYDDGEILLRAALVAKHDWTDLVDPIMYARRNEVARFRGMPKPQVEGETVLDAMRRTRNIGRWVQS